MKFTIKMPDQIRSSIMLEIRSITLIIKDMEDMAKKLNVDITSDKLYIAISSYKKGLSDVIEK